MPSKFDKNLYNQYDSLAKDVMSQWLLSKGYKDINTEETYGVDVVCKDKDDVECYFETEVKTGWRDYWPESWKEIRIPYRKRRLIDKWTRGGCHGNLTFVIFNKHLDQGWFMDSKIVNESTIKPVDNRRSANELFFHIKVPDAKLVKMKENINVSINNE
jgi:hypothetical protein|tara:strand:+ start:1569 stop:2045 length:477 start_codon:yes stop_codon:yes gene_type:complete